MGPAATGSFLRELIDDGRRDVAQVAEQARRREKRARRAVAAGVVAALLISIGAGVVAVASSDTRAEDVAARVAPQVFRQLVAESRAQRVQNARGVLGAANEVLADRGLPMVADPGAQANAEQVLAAASSAQVLSVLPEEIVTRLRDQLDGRPIVLPSATVTPDAQLGPDGPATSPGIAPAPGQPGTGPAAPGGGAGVADPGGPPGAGSPPPRTVAPPSSESPPLPTRRRLIPQIVPLPLPLIGT